VKQELGCLGEERRTGTLVVSLLPSMVEGVEVGNKSVLNPIASKSGAVGKQAVDCPRSGGRLYKLHTSSVINVDIKSRAKNPRGATETQKELI
jgi:hypothetical protein